ncbi:hypothetical protein F5Y05DRAFT_373835 [Hypoxylon sp. FL0543]|nr:hypothetical protein F5Y05DRAFT_373835 [Hypoxylon sp. FL0543]
MDPNNTPALYPPPGIEPNFVNPQSLQPERIAVSAIGLALCIIFVGGRIYIRVHLKMFNLDDCIHLFALASFITYIGLIIASGEYSDGRHQWDVTIASFSRSLELQNISDIIYCLTMFTAKYVVLRQIELIFFDHHRNNITYKAIWALIWVNLLFALSLGITFIFACVPRRKIWQPNIQGRCTNSFSTVAGGSAINMVSDYAILIVPLAAVSRLQLPVAKKLRAAAVFAVGAFACAASTVRLYYTVKLFHTDDVTWAIAPVGQWTIAEFTTVFLVACFPYVPRLLHHLNERGKNTVSDSSHTHTTFTSRNPPSGNRTNSGWTGLGEHGESHEVIMLDHVGGGARTPGSIELGVTSSD